MKTILLKPSYYKDVAQKDLKQTTTISRISPNDKDLVDTFLLNCTNKYENIKSGDTFKCTIIVDGMTYILGLFVFYSNDVRTKY